MVHSLYGRLTLFVLMTFLVMGGVALYLSSRAIDGTFMAYVDQQERENQARLSSLSSSLPDILTAYFEANPNRSDLNSIFDELSWLIPEGIILTGPDGADPMNGITLQAGAQSTHCETLVPVSSKGKLIGQVCFYPVSSVRDSKAEELFFQSIRRSLLWALAISGVVALLLSMLLLRPVLRPLEALTSAVRRMGQGEVPPPLDRVSIRELHDLTEAFNGMAKSLHHAEISRRNLISDVAHELRTPLTNMQGYLEAVGDGLLEMSPALVESLYEEALLLSRLVNDLQDLALAEAGQLRIHPQLTNLSELITNSVQLLQLPMREKAILLEMALSSDLPDVKADRERIGQVLRNLLSNALSHTPCGGIISVSTSATARHVEVQVNNSGEGIAPQHLPHVFDRFYRADESRTRSTGGYGLGLSIVKQLVEAHGGQVGVQSREGENTLFFFTLPLGGVGVGDE